MKLFSLIAAVMVITAAPLSAQEVTGAGNFSHIVESLDRSIEFYHDVVGLEPPANLRPFDPNPAIMKMCNTMGAQSRVAVLRVPGFAMGLELIEYKDIDRKPAHPRFQDPGAGNLALRVKDLDAIVVRLKKSGAHILTAGSIPAVVNGSHALFVQDPDGFVVELNQGNPPAEGGAVEITVADTEKTAAFYREALGFDPQVGASFNNSKLMTDTAGTPGAQFRQTRLTLPGGNSRLTFIEFKDIDRKALHTRVQDPGTALIQLRVRGLEVLLKKIKAAGGTIVSVDEQPVQVGTFGRIAIARDPNNLFLELIESAQ